MRNTYNGLTISFQEVSPLFRITPNGLTVPFRETSPLIRIRDLSANVIDDTGVAADVIDLHQLYELDATRHAREVLYGPFMNTGKS